MKTRVFIIANLLLSIVLILVISGFIFGWYVRTDKEEPVDVVTNGIVLSYTFDDSEEVNPETYEVNNITFFDIDNEGEGRYFTTMAVLLTLKVENRSKTNVDITVKQGAKFTYTKAAVVVDSDVLEGQYYEYDSSTKEYSLTTDTKFASSKDYYVRDPYVATAISDKELDSTKEEGTVSNFLGTDLKTSNTVTNIAGLNEETNKGGVATFYVYIYGIQPYDLATNEFLGTYDNKAKYNFSLVLQATQAQEA